MKDTVPFFDFSGKRNSLFLFSEKQRCLIKKLGNEKGISPVKPKSGYSPTRKSVLNESLFKAWQQAQNLLRSLFPFLPLPARSFYMNT